MLCQDHDHRQDGGATEEPNCIDRDQQTGLELLMAILQVNQQVRKPYGE
jgi:hypothetical protein